jgi:hypothetical protein
MDWQGWKPFQIKVGQLKVPFSREFLMTAWALQFVDRSIVNGAFSVGRDIGLEIHGELFNDIFIYHFFVVNSDGINQINLNKEPREIWFVIRRQNKTTMDS